MLQVSLPEEALKGLNVSFKALCQFNYQGFAYWYQLPLWEANKKAEELVAEIGAVMLGNSLGYELTEKVFLQSRAYLKGWLKDNDKAELLDALKLASEAVEWGIQTAGLK